MDNNNVSKKELDFKARNDFLDNNIDLYKGAIIDKRKIIDSHYDILRKNSEDENIVNVFKKAIAREEDEINNLQNIVNSLYDRKDAVEKEQRAYYRKEYEGYKESNNKETEKQADDGRVGE